MRVRAPLSRRRAVEDSMLRALASNLHQFLRVIAGLVPAISMRDARPHPTKRDGRNKSGHDQLIARVLLAGFVLVGCVQSKTQLVSGTKPLLGEQFNLNTFEDFAESKAVTVKTGAYRWSGTRYALLSGEVSGVKFFSFSPLSDSDYLVEATDDKDYAFLLAHRLAEGTYRISPVNEKNVDAATQRRLCVAQSPDTCTIATREALDTMVSASVGKTVPYTMVVVISGGATPVAP
jgi:hypothetical protein